MSTNEAIGIGSAILATLLLVAALLVHRRSGRRAQEEQVPIFLPPPTTPQKVEPYKRAPQTCMVVSPGNYDRYAEMLETLPPLVPEGEFDVYEGNPNPAVVAELSRFPEFHPGDQKAPNPSNMVPGWKNYTRGDP